MNRRRFLTLAGAGAGILAAGRAGAHGFAGGAAEGALELARARAKTWGRPLVMAWLETAAGPSAGIGREYGQRSRFWSAFLREANDRELAVLAPFEVAFCPLPAEHAESPALGMLYPAAGGPGHLLDIPWRGQKELAAAFDLSGMAAALGAILDKAFGTEHLLGLPADGSKDDTDEKRSLRSGAQWAGNMLHPRRNRPAEIEPHVNGLWTLARTDATRSHVFEMLADVTLHRLFLNSPPGAQWSVEETDPCPACGMGFIPPHSREFLGHFTR
ncbi:MAG: hypothetical protein R3F17_05865 [Planctomycetota bacterium]